MNTVAIRIDKEERMLSLKLMCHYYRGDLWQLELSDWQNLTNLLESQRSILQNEWVNKAIAEFRQLKNETIETFQFDFNRLFVGPNHLLASPFESSYENFEGMLMQQETIKVRNFYHHEGLQVENEGQLPDDHIQFELEFLLHLLNSNKHIDPSSVYKLFLERHLLKWVPKHIKLVEKNSQNNITMAFAYLLKGLLQLEKMAIEGGDRNDI